MSDTIYLCIKFRVLGSLKDLQWFVEVDCDTGCV